MKNDPAHHPRKLRSTRLRAGNGATPAPSPNTPGPTASPSSVTARWISAIVGIPLFLVLCLAGPTPFCAALIVVTGIAALELWRAVRGASIYANPLPMAMAVASPVIGMPIGRFWIWDFEAYPIFVRTLIMVFIVTCLWELVRAARTGRPQAAQGVAYGTLCGAYLSLFATIAWLRQKPLETQGGLAAHVDPSALLVLLLFLCVWATDSAAFFAGSRWGQRKLAPALSPGKTVEGALAGAAAGILCGALCGRILMNRPFFGVVVGAIAGSFGQMGDLFESALKRELGIKDFGALLPGHGGILDRFDSVLFAAAALVTFLEWYAP
ncbi:MAG: phosphatidate cytidylyltransferase [Chthonomonadales bacterium]